MEVPVPALLWTQRQVVDPSRTYAAMALRLPPRRHRSIPGLRHASARTGVGAAGAGLRGGWCWGLVPGPRSGTEPRTGRLAVGAAGRDVARRMKDLN